MAVFLKEEFLKKFKAWKATTLIVQLLIQVLYLQVTQIGVRAAVVLLVEERISQPFVQGSTLMKKEDFLQRGDMQASSISDQETFHCRAGSLTNPISSYIC